MKILDHTAHRPTYHHPPPNMGVGAGSGFDSIDDLIAKITHTPKGIPHVPDHRPLPPGPRRPTNHSIESAVLEALREVSCRTADA